jgi:acetoin utilization protein AcuC
MATRESVRDPRPILVYGPWSARYDLGPAHPLTPRRFGPGIDLLTAVSGGPPRLLEPEPASDEALLAIHAAAYIRTVRRLGETPFRATEAGIGPGDTPAFAGMHEAAAAVAGGSLRAMEAILAGETIHAFHPGGGLHHAMRDRAGGFCIYNDPALAISRARQAGLRVLYVDLDVHHGDGVQAIHADDPGVLTFSIHQSGRTLFPGTGYVGELGEGVAAGTVLNLPVDPGTGERGWLAALRKILPEIAATFGPDVVVSQHGADAHAWDPLANLRVTTTAMGEAARLVDAIAHRWAGGRWLATGGGGYDAYRVVPRAWSLVWLAALHAEWRLAVPAAWRERWDAEAARYGPTPLPDWLEDEANAGLRPDATQDLADRRAVETAALLRELTVPALLRAATDLGWWRAAEDLARDGRVAAPGSGDAPTPSSPAAGSPRIVASVDAGTWDRLDLEPGALPVADDRAAHALVLAALRSPDAVAVTAAVVAGSMVGVAVSCAPAGDAGAPRLLLALGVGREWRRRGLAAGLLGEHLRAAITSSGWSAAVTLAERDPIDPLPRPVRADIARRLLEGAGFQVEAATGPVGSADLAAFVARRG